LYYAALFFSFVLQIFELVSYVPKEKRKYKSKMKENDKIKGLEPQQKKKNVLTVLELANEHGGRELNVKMIDLAKSDAKDFCHWKALLWLAPFRAVPSFRCQLANQIVRSVD